MVAFTEYWKRVGGAYAKELVFGSQAATHEDLFRIPSLDGQRIRLQPG